jgi:hypothetical protein
LTGLAVFFISSVDLWFAYFLISICVGKRGCANDTRQLERLRSGDHWWCSVFNPRMVGVHYRIIIDAACVIRNGRSPFRCKILSHC